MNEHTLRDVPVGEMARIVAIRPTHRSYRSKLLSMGLTRGTVVRVERVAPLGDPVVISVRGFELSLRKDEA
ncbi:MAG: FeoA family protein, partial [Spirochaetota bacterium]